MRPFKAKSPVPCVQKPKGETNESTFAAGGLLKDFLRKVSSRRCYRRIQLNPLTDFVFCSLQIADAHELARVADVGVTPTPSGSVGMALVICKDGWE